MAIDGFSALMPRSAADGAHLVRVVELGTLTIRSGRLEACDPRHHLGTGAVLPAPNGDFRVAATVVDEAGHGRRPAYLSVLFSTAGTVWVGPAQPETDDGDGHLFDGIGVRSGAAGFVDHEAAVAGTGDVIEALGDPADTADDNLFTVLQTRDRSGALTGYHIDFGVLADPDEV